MEMFRSVAGTVTVRLESADTSGFLTEISKAGVKTEDVQRDGALSVRFRIQRVDYRTVKNLAERKGAQISIISRKGIYWKLIPVLNRPVLLAGLAILLAAILYLPGRVLFIRVEGNASVPTNLILENAEKCGLYFGAKRGDVRSEQIKNGLLESVEQLQWAGVNTAGCVATVSVRERTDYEKTTEEHGVSSIVAVRDGVIESCTVTRGNALCKVGQAVKAGEVLVSGYTDCGISIRATRAEGEIFARTFHEITVLSPTNSVQRGEITGCIKKYGLILGKKRINFNKDSGISYTSCDKMYMEYYIMLPGGFRLPVAIVEEIWYTYDTEVISVSKEYAQITMTQFAESYLKEHMLGGTVLQSETQLQLNSDVYILNGQYRCLEMIGRVRSEEIMESNGENH